MAVFGPTERFFSISQGQDAGKVVLGGLTTIAQTDKKKMLATVQAYAVKIAVIFVPLPPPLGVIIEKGALLGGFGKHPN